MIGSICKAWRNAHGGVPTDLPEIAEDDGLTRSSFLRVMAAGVLAAGVGGGSGQASASGTSGSKAIPPVTDLDKFYDAWQDRFNAWDVDALLDLYLPDVTYINPDGKELSGQAAVRADLGGLLALKPKVSLGNRKHIAYQDTVLTTNHWTLKLPNADGTIQELTGGGIEVIRKQADGGWRFIIDDASRKAS
jgi:ketosteroid isomerase-like protein